MPIVLEEADAVVARGTRKSLTVSPARARLRPLAAEATAADGVASEAIGSAASNRIASRRGDWHRARRRRASLPTVHTVGPRTK
eukprot:4550356-Pleurochrysis_carterae.AAC.2